MDKISCIIKIVPTPCLVHVRYIMRALGPKHVVCNKEHLAASSASSFAFISALLLIDFISYTWSGGALLRLRAQLPIPQSL
ncbi:hypothetical protein XELAEV_18035265mg [Xenopus laevis]|uniref:Uncharacterized protein n=1 Tax=Xenopus laevis TaxID=8355 RepID=A0A974HBY5_XENLA|nr:hypothetical protein XELAEV_18035265mg [Xenopus laevis]